MKWFFGFLNLIGWGTIYLTTYWGETSENGWGFSYQEVVTEWQFKSQTWDSITKIWT